MKHRSAKRLRATVLRALTSSALVRAATRTRRATLIFCSSRKPPSPSSSGWRNLKRCRNGRIPSLCERSAKARYCMKHRTEEFERWVKQARHELEAARKDIENRFFADACYSAEQAAQKALKGYLYLKGARSVWKHSVKELLDECTKFDPAFAAHADAGRVLDQYYIPTRYPDALAPPAVPFESYTETQAKESIVLAMQIVETGEHSMKE